MITPGRREQHKAATRSALQDAALQMFEERGYAQTTVRDISGAAGVTERTFFRYFRSKEDLVLGEVLDLLPVLTEHIRTRPRGEPPYPAILNSLLAVGAERPGGVGILFSGPPARFPASTRRPDAVLLQFEDGIAAALAERSGDGDTLRASVLARAAVGAIRATLIAYAHLPDEDKTMTTALRLVQDAFAALQSGR
ncbi:TetR family transcriptional regulator [Kribbella sp. VKM Ac-2527]|uniref:TetR family transcriptional regulator n=1 Tax=Kribbella caucasensis TaxID=2512215 RepID=A0A4R6J4F0_9ACTN|nr:TetR family transcriptional regulator [Kribbella sp. VKM Ac-2527]TDO29847.1 TetR family transcriptional regulator [Kribbella sp. VKM Ac-2527]